jgi:hypothetical protein
MANRQSALALDLRAISLCAMDLREANLSRCSQRVLRRVRDKNVDGQPVCEREAQ